MGLQKRLLEAPISEDYNLRCNHCGFVGKQKISLKFFEKDLERVRNREMIIPQFMIKCVCAKCNRYIKFLPFNPYLFLIEGKEINYVD